jgi:hypothetical protein
MCAQLPRNISFGAYLCKDNSCPGIDVEEILASANNTIPVHIMFINLNFFHGSMKIKIIIINNRMSLLMPLSPSIALTVNT